MNIKKIIISAATVAAFVAAGTIAYCTSEKNHEKDLVQANYEALLDGEGGSYSTCYSDYSFHFTKRVLRCITCDYAWGHGEYPSGECYAINK